MCRPLRDALILTALGATTAAGILIGATIGTAIAATAHHISNARRWVARQVGAA